jgi:hypothetical protein
MLTADIISSCHSSFVYQPISLAGRSGAGFYQVRVMPFVSDSGAPPCMMKWWPAACQLLNLKLGSHATLPSNKVSILCNRCSCSCVCMCVCVPWYPQTVFKHGASTIRDSGIQASRIHATGNRASTYPASIPDVTLPTPALCIHAYTCWEVIALSALSQRSFAKLIQIQNIRPATCVLSEGMAACLALFGLWTEKVWPLLSQC